MRSKPPVQSTVAAAPALHMGADAPGGEQGSGIIMHLHCEAILPFFNSLSPGDEPRPAPEPAPMCPQLTRERRSHAQCHTCSPSPSGVPHAELYPDTHVQVFTVLYLHKHL